jgi:hypothetical protein
MIETLRIALLITLLVALSDDGACGEPAVDTATGSARILRKQVQSQPAAMQSGTGAANTNLAGGMSSTNGIPPDVYEATMLQAIASVRSQLETAGLNTNTQHYLEWKLGQDQWLLSNHQAQVQSRLLFVQSAHADPRMAWTNRIDPVEKLFSSDVAHYERELADPALAANSRKTDEAMLEFYRQKLADRRTNMQLWADLRMGRQNKNAEQITQSERRLANYLAIKLGKMQGKTYPAGISLDAILEQYRIQAGGGKFDRRKIIVGVLVLVTLLPLAFLTFKTMARRKK